MGKKQKKREVFTGEKNRSDFRKGLKQKQKHSDSASSSTEEDFSPQQAETCANEVRGSGQIFVEFKSEGNEALAFVVGFSLVIVTSLVG